MNDVLFDERSKAEVTTGEKQNRQGSALSGLFLKFSSETDNAKTGDVVCLLPALQQPKNDARPTEIATNGERQKLDNEQRTAHNPKRGSHTNWVGASMVCRGAKRHYHPVSWSPVRADSSTSDVPNSTIASPRIIVPGNTFTRSPSKSNVASTTFNQHSVLLSNEQSRLSLRGRKARKSS